MTKIQAYLNFCQDCNRNLHIKMIKSRIINKFERNEISIFQGEKEMKREKILEIDRLPIKEGRNVMYSKVSK